MKEEVKAKMQKAIEHFKEEIKTIRTGRANPGMLDHVMVEVYGSQMRLKELANVSVPDARQLLVSPFDPQTAGAISKGIEKAQINLTPLLEGHLVRIHIPPMDESMRKEMVKQGKKKAEEAKVLVREIRRKQNEVVRKSTDLTEDEAKKMEKLIQEMTDQYCKEIDTLMTAKEKEIMVI